MTGNGVVLGNAQQPLVAATSAGHQGSESSYLDPRFVAMLRGVAVQSGWSRVFHPIWEGPTGWIVTYRHSPKSTHFAAHPYLSLAYVHNPLKPVYVECGAVWNDDPAAKQHVWELFKQAPPPLGYDPASIWSSVGDPAYGVLRLTPWRIATRGMKRWFMP